MNRTDRTHDPRLRSWVDSANRNGSDFPIQNLPFGVFVSHKHRNTRSIGVAIGDRILDLAACVRSAVLPAVDPSIHAVLLEGSLNGLMKLGRSAAAELRRTLSAFLSTSSAARPEMLVGMTEVDMVVPAVIGDYTDFYASVHHATNVGNLFRPGNPLLPNYKYVPIGYHGRASSIIPSGTPVHRPYGQVREDSDAPPQFTAARMLDYELEVGFYIGAGSHLGGRVPLFEAPDHLFGACLVNDWSARDIQSWEYQPLGPFLAKSFATSVSPWVVTMAALEPFRTAASLRPEGDPAPLPHLFSKEDQAEGGLDLRLEVFLSTEAMRSQHIDPVRLSHGNLATLYWTPAQLVTHHASNGCNLRPGDLLASGTVSGAGDDERGCLLELTARGSRPLDLPTGEQRRFLEDGDEVILRGHCEREGCTRIGFGECCGRVLPA